MNSIFFNDVTLIFSPLQLPLPLNPFKCHQVRIGSVRSHFLRNYTLLILGRDVNFVWPIFHSYLISPSTSHRYWQCTAWLIKEEVLRLCLSMSEAVLKLLGLDWLDIIMINKFCSCIIYKISRCKLNIKSKVRSTYKCNLQSNCTNITLFASLRKAVNISRAQLRTVAALISFPSDGRRLVYFHSLYGNSA